MTSPVRTILLFKTEGSSDKFYGLTITPDGDLFRLNYMNGPRGGSMKTKPKLADAVPLAVAQKEFDKVMKAKMKDGYTESESGLSYTNSPDAGRVSGYRPMLPADLPKTEPQATLKHLLDSDDWALQEKKDGENRILIINNAVVRGTNKNGLFVNIPDSWSAFGTLGDCVLCGEQIGETYYAFDLIDPAGLDFSERYEKLAQLLQKAPALPGISLVSSIEGSAKKREAFNRIDQLKGEGVVFKRLYAPFEEGKNSNTIRHKFWESMTCLVLDVNTQRSVAVGARDADGQMVPLGNVTIPSNQPIPTKGERVEVRYLYQHEKGALCQPTYLGARSDVAFEAVSMDQITRIKRKGEPVDLDDDTLSVQARQALAREEFAHNLASLKHFLPKNQRQAIQELSSGEEGQFYMDKAQELAERIRQMPQSYDTNGQGLKAVAHMRYFIGGCEWLITEKDRGSSADPKQGVQHQAFGAADLGYGPELGYISIEELIQNNVEMDFYFEPQTLEAYADQQKANPLSNEQPASWG